MTTRRNPYFGQTVDPYHGAEFIDTNRPIPDVTQHTMPGWQQQQYQSAGSMHASSPPSYTQPVNVSASYATSIPPDRPVGLPPSEQHHGIDAGDVVGAVALGIATYAVISAHQAATPAQRAAARPWLLWSFLVPVIAVIIFIVGLNSSNLVLLGLSMLVGSVGWGACIGMYLKTLERPTPTPWSSWYGPTDEVITTDEVIQAGYSRVATHDDPYYPPGTYSNTTTRLIVRRPELPAL